MREQRATKKGKRCAAKKREGRDTLKERAMRRKEERATRLKKEKENTPRKR